MINVVSATGLVRTQRPLAKLRFPFPHIIHPVTWSRFEWYVTVTHTADGRNLHHNGSNNVSTNNGNKHGTALENWKTIIPPGAGFLPSTVIAWDVEQHLNPPLSPSEPVLVPFVVVAPPVDVGGWGKSSKFGSVFQWRSPGLDTSTKKVSFSNKTPKQRRNKMQDLRRLVLCWGV